MLVEPDCSLVARPYFRRIVRHALSDLLSAHEERVRLELLRRIIIRGATHGARALPNWI